MGKLKLILNKYYNDKDWEISILSTTKKHQPKLFKPIFTGEKNNQMILKNCFPIMLLSFQHSREYKIKSELEQISTFYFVFILRACVWKW